MDIDGWLRGLGLERYAQAFRDHEIDVALLPKLTDEHLRELGLPLGPRLKLLEAIGRLHDDSAPSVLAPASDFSARSPPSSLAERRQLTVLFVDLVGSTSLSGRLDPEELREVLQTFQNAIIGEIARYEGYIARFLGDGVLAYFGWPKAHEDAAERAVRAGLGIVDRLPHLATPAGGPLAARVSIATGHVVVGDLIGSEEARERTVVGETPNLAARLQELAEPGVVLIAERTRRLLGELFAYRALPPTRLKGFAEPVPVYHVLGEGAAEGRFEAIRGATGLTPLVGREHELALLLDRWARVKEGKGQVVLLTGDAGIGKSRLVRALRAQLTSEPHAWLSHFCSPYYANSALHPLVGWFEREAGLRREDPPELLLDRLEVMLALTAEDIGRHVPLLADFLGIPTGDRYTPLLELGPQQRKEQTFQALLDHLAGLAARQPMVALYEDVHWADPTTLEFLGRLVDRIRRLPVLAVATFRPEFVPTWTRYDHTTLFSLGRLRRRQSEALIERVAGGKVLPTEILQQILTRTDGVPLFLEELTKAVLESGLLAERGNRYELDRPLPPLAIPATLQDSLMARLDRLAPVREVAQVGAVIGREFSHELLAAVMPLADQELRDALSRLVDSELIFTGNAPPQVTYVFKHALVRDAAYQSLLKSRRRQLHARIADVLEQRFGDQQPREPELLAHHYREAGLPEKAIPFAIRAGEVAFGRFAFFEAMARYREALDMARTVPLSDRALYHQLQATVRLAHIYQLLGEFGHMPANEAYPEAKSAALKALELDAANAEAYYVLAIILGLYDWDWAGSEHAYKRALELDPASIQAHQHYGIFLLTPLGRHEEAASELEQALELDPHISWTEVDLAGALIRARRPDKAIARLVSVIGRDPTFAHAHRQLGVAYAQMGRHEQAIAEFSRTVELSHGEAFATAQLGWAYGVAGHKARAQSLLDELTVRAEGEHVDPLAFAWLNIGLGDTEAAFSWLEKAYEAKSSWLIFLKVQEIYEPLHLDPRYHTLLRRLGLEPVSV